MYRILFSSLLLLRLISASSNPGPVKPLPNDLGLVFNHHVNKRENTVVISFEVSNTTLTTYRYYYFDFRAFGDPSRTQYFPQQRLVDRENSLKILGLHEGDYVACLTFVDEYEKKTKPRYACYEFTLGEKIIGSHHGNRSGYLVPLLCVVAFILQVFIAVVHHIKAKNYAHKLLSRFIDVAPKSNRRKKIVQDSLKELDHHHPSASVQRRLSRVSVDAIEENRSHHNEGFLASDELPLYTLPHHSRRVSLANAMATIHEHGTDTISSRRQLIEATPVLKRNPRGPSSSPSRSYGQIQV